MKQFDFSKYETINQCLSEVWEAIQNKINTILPEMVGKSPHVSENGVYDNMRHDWWTSGFWPGILWILYDITGEEQYREHAWMWDEEIEKCFTRESNLHHDVGFQFLPTAVIKYKLTGNMEARRRGLLAANFLAGRFNIAGKFIRAWNQQERTGWSIIDTCMNLSLLFWAAEELKEPRFRHIAKAHADTVVKNFIKEDGSVRHIVSFNPESGERIEALGGQGYAPESAWSRGQAWAIYGLANTFRSTNDIKYLRAAQRVAHFFIASLPEDAVAYWDFRVPQLEGEPRDTSAAACAASGLLEIAKHLPKEEAAIYVSAAKKIMLSLTKHYATWDKPEYQGILLEATGHKPAGQNVNVSLIYGDYFYVECIAKLYGWNSKIF